MNFGLNQPKKLDPARCRLSAALNLLAKLVTEHTSARNTTVENIPPLDWIVQNITNNNAANKCYIFCSRD